MPLWCTNLCRGASEPSTTGITRLPATDLDVRTVDTLERDGGAHAIAFDGGETSCGELPFDTVLIPS